MLVNRQVTSPTEAVFDSSTVHWGGERVNLTGKDVVGLSVGLVVGLLVGVSVGALVGVVVGLFVGLLVRLLVERGRDKSIVPFSVPLEQH